MKVTSLKATQFRNLSQVAVTPCEGMNVFYGDNAHGKTNLLEAMWLATGGKSFRGSKDSDLVRFGADKAQVEIGFFAGGRPQKAAITIEGRRKAMLNDIPLATANRLMGTFCAVIFSPDHLSLIKDGPEGRRRFVDAACCQLRPLYMKSLAEYTRVLTQRNKLIKAVKSGETPFDPILMDAFDERLAQSGQQVRRFRKEYIEALSPYVTDIYAGLSRGREALKISYDAGKDSGGELLSQLQQTRSTDLRAGFTTVGPHRDDIEVTIGGLSARLFGSQGQQRSAVLSLKLAEASLLSDGYGEKPVILLDDVMSELDHSRQEYILNHIEQFQVFITCCEATAITRLKGGCVFHIENGIVQKVKE